MQSIHVDFDVFKKITALRKSEKMTENDVLREVFELPKADAEMASDQHQNDGSPWVLKGVSFPHGTKFRAIYKGQQFMALVDNGSLLLNEKRFPSPSAAAVSITGNSVNGWKFWECLMPGAIQWKPIGAYRE